MNNLPPWLKSIQNGSIGETRTKSFLMDRFWVLERSVDIHGVDFIIQRRLYDQNLLDEKPPRFGVVQAKFSHNENTCHNIHKEYILDKDDNPRIEFFLIIHTGDEDNQKMFLLTTKDISEDFSINKDMFVVPSRKVFSSPKYEIKCRKNTLDRMEYSIQCAEFYKNRSFIYSRLSSVAPNFNAILPEYKEDIENWLGDIPEIFKSQKEKAFNTISEIEEIHELLKNFVESIDPIEACYLAEELDGIGNSFHLPEIFDSNFYYVAKNLKEMVDNMRSDGALDNYISTRKIISSKINSFLQGYSIADIDNNTIHKIKIEYNPYDFSFIDITNSILHLCKNELYKVFLNIINAKEGYIVLSWKIGITVKNNHLVRMNDACLHAIMEKIYALKYYEGEEI